MNAYRIYGRYLPESACPDGFNDGRFRPLDVGAGAFVGNLIHATLFYDRTEADRICKRATAENPDFEFEIRTVRNA